MSGPRGAWGLAALAGINFVALNAWHSLVFGPHDGLERGPDGSLSGYSFEAFSVWRADVLAKGHGDAFLGWHTRFLDLAFPLLLTAALAMLTVKAGRLLPRFAAMRPSAQWGLALVFGLPYLMFDFAENTLVAQMLANASAPDAAAVSLASSMTAAKWAFVALALVMPAVLGSTAFLVGKRRARQ